MSRKKATFRAAVEATPQISTAWRPGIQALIKADRGRLQNTNLATGSIALDEALLSQYPDENRWDYGIGLAATAREGVLWLEPHHAASGEAERVIRKLQWLKSWLGASAPELDRMDKIFVWHVTSEGKNPNDRRRRNQLAEKHGLRVHRGILDLAALVGG